MFAWLRSSRRRNRSTDRYEDGRPKAGYYALQDPYGSALEDFDDAFDFRPDAPRRKRRFWHRKPKLNSGIEQPLFGEQWKEPETRWYQPSHYRGRRKRWWLVRLIAALLAIFIAIVAWLAITAPLGKSLEPIAPPQITLLASDGTPIARSGASVDAPVVASELPDHVVGAFLAIEDRRFYSHWGIDPRGIARAAWTGVGGGSTITQQLAKFTFLTPEQTLSRKAREALIAFWLETWLTKDEILSRYLSNAYFGDNQYGLRAASLHYFYRQPENLRPEQAAMLAGLLKAPSRLAPTRNYDLAEERMRLVIGAMAEERYLTDARARNLPSPRLDVRNRNRLPTGTYFADWALPIARQSAEASYAKQTLTTTLDARLQGVASRAVANAALGNAQVALVAMRPSGEVVAMIGGKDYANSPFNRATQAKRQPGSTFKLFVYLAALGSGMRPTDRIDNTPIETGSYRPKNAAERYSDSLTLEQAFASSSNVAAVRLFNQLGSKRVIETARNLGITSPLPEGDPSLALGTSTMSLLELTSAYAAVAADAYPVEPHAFLQEEEGWIEWLFDGQSHFPGRVQSDMERLLRAAINDGTGKAAMLAGPNFGKTGTTQDYRDAVFVGYAGDLVVGVWVGNDDNTSLNGVTGGGLPARIWRNFMRGALAGSDIVEPAERPDPEGPIRPLDIEELRDIPIDDNGPTLSVEQEGLTVVTEIDGLPVEFRLTEDGLEIESGRR